MRAQQEKINLQDKRMSELRVDDYSNDLCNKNINESNNVPPIRNFDLVNGFDSAVNEFETNKNNSENLKISLNNRLESEMNLSSVINSIDNTNTNADTSAKNSAENTRIKKFNFNNNLHKRILKNELTNILTPNHIVEDSISKENNKNLLDDMSLSNSNENNTRDSNFLLNRRIEREKHYIQEEEIRLPDDDKNNLI